MDRTSGQHRELLPTGSTLSNNVNVSASNDAAGLRLSVGTDRTTGIVPNSSLNRLSGMLSGNATFWSKLTVNSSVQYTQNKGKNRPENGYTEGQSADELHLVRSPGGRRRDESQVLRQGQPLRLRGRSPSSAGTTTTIATRLAGLRESHTRIHGIA
jgi:hypothetical protein